MKSPRERLRSWRIRSELTQSQAAALFGTRREMYCRWENGKAVPSIDTQDRIELETGIPIDAWPDVHRGELSASAKLTQSDVLEIRRRRATGETLASLARDFGVAVCTVERAAKGETWAHVPMLDEQGAA